MTGSHRLANLEDCETMFVAEGATWSPLHMATRETIYKRLKYHGGTTMLAFNAANGRLDGFLMTIQVASEDVDQVKPWQYYADQAVKREEHSQKELSHLYSLSLTVRPDAPSGTATELIRTFVERFKGDRWSSLVTVVRVPNYSRNAALGIAFSDYYLGLQEERYREPLFHIFRVTNADLCGYIPDYFQDPESSDYGVKFSHNLSMA